MQSERDVTGAAGEGADVAGAAGGGAGEPSEEELRAALEEEMKRVRVQDVLLQTVVSLLNLGGRRAGLAPGTEGERDLAQVQIAIEGVRALLPLVERSGDAAASADMRAIKDALAQLQLAYARLGGGKGQPAQAGSGESSGEAPSQAQPGSGERAQEPGPARSSGRLWIPGQ